MKQKYIFISILLLLMLGACSLNDITEVNGDCNHILSFSAHTHIQTRGIETKLGNIKTSGFGIMAYLTKDNYDTSENKLTFMDNQQVTYNGTSWTYSPTRYWPSTERLSFFAYAPYTSESINNGITIVNTAGEDPKLDFTVQTNLKNMIDLVTATRLDQQFNTMSSSSDGKLTFDFNHILTGVKMYVKLPKEEAENKQVRMYITKMKLKHNNKLAAKGVFNMKTSQWTPSTTDFFVNEIDLGDVTNGLITFPVINAEDQSASGITNGIQVPGNSTGVSLFPEDHSLYLIPINGTTGCSAGDVQVEITYSLLTRATDTSDNWIISTANQTVPIPEGGFKQGYIQCYTFVLGKNITVETKIEGMLMNIATADDLIRFRNIVNGSNGENKNAELKAIQTADIDMATLPDGNPDKTNWTPIENYEGMYNGGEYAIYNLKRTSSIPTAMGLFASTTENSVLTGINLENVLITNAQNNVGALVGTSNGIVSKCSAIGNLSSGTGTNAGGLIGEVTSSSHVTFCKATVNIIHRATMNNVYVGGLVGYNNGIVVACAAFGTVNQQSSSSHDVRIGGFAGTNTNKIYGCYATGSVSGSGANMDAVGGFMGTDSYTTSQIVGCYSKGSASLLKNGSSSNATAGGFVAGNVMILGYYENCFSTGAASNNKIPIDWGGFIFRSKNATVKNCFTTQSQGRGPISGAEKGDIDITANADASTLRSVVRTAPTNDATNTQFKIATSSGSIITVTWNPQTFWSETAGTDDAPEINWDIY